MTDDLDTDVPEIPPIPFTYRYEAPDDARRKLAWASVRYTLFAARQQQIFYAVIVVFALLLQTTKGWSPFGTALAEALIFMAVGLVSVVLWSTTVGYAQTYHSTRYRFPPGAVLESGFGDDGFVLRGPTGESYAPYTHMKGAIARGDFVFFSLGSIAGTAVFPRALFPDHEVARINAA